MAERSSALRLTAALLVLAVALALAQVAGVQGADSRVTTGHGLSIHGDLKYGPGFAHFAYVNPRAPRGGSVTLPAIGTFDNLNPFILKGVPAAGIGNTFDTLTVASFDCRDSVGMALPLLRDPSPAVPPHLVGYILWSNK